MNALLEHPKRHPITSQEFLRMDEAGVFESDARLELIERKIIEMAPIGDRHASVVAALTELFVRMAADRGLVWVHSSLLLARLLALSRGPEEDTRTVALPNKAIEAPLTPEELAQRWRALCDDPTFEDVAGKIELTEWGEILTSPVCKSHGLAAMRVGEVLRRSLGGHAMAEVGIATSIGVRAPDVAWCSEDFLAAHPEEMPLSSAPELCVEIVSASNALPKLREKAMAYVTAGAVEAWLVYPQSKQLEICGREGRKETTSFAVDDSALFT